MSKQQTIFPFSIFYKIFLNRNLSVYQQIKKSTCFYFIFKNISWIGFHHLLWTKTSPDFLKKNFINLFPYRKLLSKIIIIYYYFYSIYYIKIFLRIYELVWFKQVMYLVLVMRLTHFFKFGFLLRKIYEFRNFFTIFNFLFC